jgi:hypothetical protein
MEINHFFLTLYTFPHTQSEYDEQRETKFKWGTLTFIYSKSEVHEGSYKLPRNQIETLPLVRCLICEEDESHEDIWFHLWTNLQLMIFLLQSESHHSCILSQYVLVLDQACIALLLNYFYSQTRSTSHFYPKEPKLKRGRLNLH